MRIFCEGFELANAMTTVIKATSTRTTNPILEGIKLKADDEYLILSATDGELAIEKKIPADVKLAGEVVVPGKLFAEFVRKLSGESNILTAKCSFNVKVQVNSQPFNKLKAHSFLR